MITRTMLLWCPDWPITAAVRAGALDATAPIALIDRSEVYACSTAARREGVRRGQRVRDAQARCPALLVLRYEAGLDSRAFAPVLSALEQTVPGVQPMRPGLAAMHAKGPAQFYGGEEEAALWLLDAVHELGIHDARVAIADGPFTAEQAVRRPRRARIGIVPAGRSAEFLAPLPVGRLGDEALATLLRRLGIRTLGEFAALDPSDVAARFGVAGGQLHSLAAGADSRPVLSRRPPDELDRSIDFEPPLDRIDQATFGFRTTADLFIEGLVAAKLVCTALRIEVDAANGEVSERSWLHPRSFTAADVVDRLRWQLQGSGSATGSGLGSPLTRVRVLPETVDAIGNHEQGLWGSGRDERIHHALSRVQSMLGHGGVLTATVGGGRGLRERGILSAWGDRPPVAAHSPWPGRLADPAPSAVFEQPLPAEVFDVRGEAVRVDARGTLSGTPDRFSTDGRTLLGISAWAGPWPLNERWWDAARARSVHRFQVVDPAGSAWLLVLEGGLWRAEARYD